MDVNGHEIQSNITLKTPIKVKEQLVVRKDKDVNEHERQSNITLKTQIQEKKQCFYCCSTFHSHCRVFNNENNSYHKMSVKRPLVCCICLHSGCIQNGRHYALHC
jgi:hypothetical protein